MSNSIIEVNNLSKSYTISHEGRERYTALRDVMAQKAKKIFSFPTSLRGGSRLLSGKQSPYKEEFWALKDVSFKIEQGDRVGIIGRNGAGKSTLLKILSRITEPTAGEIKIKGRVASLLEVGTGFHPELTGRENIFLNGAILGMSRVEIKKHFDAIVDFAETEKFLDTPVKRYSSGMYVRLAFAVAAHLEPEILVVDEVLAVGDAQFQKKCLGKMEDVSKNEGRTVLFVSHNMSVIKLFCSTGILLNSGELVHSGNLDKVVEAYQNLSVPKTEVLVEREISDKRFYFKNVCLLNDRGEIVTRPVLGEKLIIKVKYSSNGTINKEYIALDFTIKDIYNNVVVAFISDEIKSDFNEFKKEGYISCIIDHLYLRAGTYTLRLFASYNGTGEDCVLDEIEEIVVFDVESSDYFGVGKVLRSNTNSFMPGRFSSE